SWIKCSRPIPTLASMANATTAHVANKYQAHEPGTVISAACCVGLELLGNNPEANGTAAIPIKAENQTAKRTPALWRRARRRPAAATETITKPCSRHATIRPAES